MQRAFAGKLQLETEGCVRPSAKRLGEHRVQDAVTESLEERSGTSGGCTLQLPTFEQRQNETM